MERWKKEERERDENYRGDERQMDLCDGWTGWEDEGI